MSNPWFKTRTECPACASGRFRTLYQSPYDEPPIKEYLQAFYSPQGMVEAEYLSGAIYVLSECDVCGLVFQMDIPNEALMERLYEHWIDPKKALTKDHNHDLRYYSPYAEEIMRIISYFRTKPSSLCFLDFGMGWGNWALMAKAFGCDSYGTELSLARVAYATEHGVKVITWDEIPQHRFDLVNAEQVFEHIPEPLNTLRHVKMALKPNGVVKISVPPGNDIRRRLALLDWLAPKSSSRSLNPVAPLEHINCFTRASIVQMADAAGMEEVFIPMMVQYRYMTDWSGAKVVAKNLLRPIYRNVLKRQNYIFLRSRGN